MNTFNKALLKYLKEDDKEELESLLISPKQIIDSELIPANHFLIDEAILILDCLSSYNKRISNKEREHELLEIPESSPLYSWRCGTLAIKEFYNNNNHLVTNYLNEISEHSPLQKLKLYILKDKDTALFTEDNNLNSSIDALKDVIENNLVDMYAKTVKLLLDDLKANNETDLQNTILTIIEESISNIPLDVIHKSIINVVPLCESTRLMALGTMYKLPIKSLEYLFSYFTLVDFDNKDDVNLQALILVIQDLVKALIQEKYKFESSSEREMFIKNSNLFILNLSKYYTIDFKASENPLTNLRRAIDIKNKSEKNFVYSGSEDKFQKEWF